MIEVVDNFISISLSHSITNKELHKKNGVVHFEEVKTFSDHGVP